jgi:ribonuclease P protein component
MTKTFSLSKQERLKSKKDIDTLFQTGEAFFIFPFKVIYRFVEALPEEVALKVMVTIPKRLHKRANKRNRLRRITKECYRLNKTALKESLQHSSLHLMFIYTTTEMLTSAQILPSVQKILQKLVMKVVSNE